MSKEKIKNLEATGREVMFVGYCENFKAYRIYISGQRKAEISRDVTFNENAALGKTRDLPPPPPPKEEDVGKDIIDGISMPKSYDIDFPMEPIYPLDPPPSNPPTRKRPLWVRDTL